MLKRKAVLLPLVLVCGLLASCGKGYSNGDRVGTITKLSYKGLICKTWEGTMAMASFQARGTGNAQHFSSGMSNSFDFSVDPSNTEVLKDLQVAMDSGKPVKLEYSQWVIQPPCTLDSDYEIVSVTFIKD